MSSEEFWRLTWWDWNLWVFRIMEVQKKRRDDAELLIELERNSMALNASVQTGKQFTGTDFYKLSFDKTDTVVEEKEDIQEAIKRLETKAKKIIKRG